ncbi:hypothetical protein SCA6_020277 [Theobroma cacao]
MECNVACLRNCSCVAYARTDANKCVMWFGSLLDMREYTNGGQDLCIRVATLELGYDPGAGEEALDLPSFDMVTVATATNDYLFTNKIGAGGFGHVYKGKLPTGQEIAVKRLSKDSQQGLQEFKNEVILIAKLQHRNLVKLLGCCIHGEEKIGYMSPEYAIEGLFLVKSDVFSFGVLVLEIISGKRKRGFYHSNHDMNLLGHAWKLWNEDKALQLGDALMEKSVTT